MESTFAVQTAAWMVAMLVAMGIASRAVSASEAERVRCEAQSEADEARNAGEVHAPVWVRPARQPRALATASNPAFVPFVPPAFVPSDQCPADLVGDPRDLIVRRAGDPRVFMTRAFLDKALEDQAELMHTARFVPEMRDGRIIGVRMFGVREGSTLAQLGIRSGDTLLRISGYDMSSPDKALEAYATLRTRSELDVEILRGGQWMVVRYVLC